LLDVKSLTPKVHDRVMDLFVGRYGSHAGWAHSLLFAAELPRFADRLPQELLDEMQLFREEEKRVKLAMKSGKASPTKTARSPTKVKSPTKSKSPRKKIKMEDPSVSGEPPAAGSTDADGGSGSAEQHPTKRPKKF